MKDITHLLECSGGVFVGINTELAGYWKQRGGNKVVPLDDTFYVSLGPPNFTNTWLFRQKL